MARLIQSDGSTIELETKMRQPADIRVLVGGQYVLHDMGHLYMAYQDNNTLDQNMAASRIAGRVIRGPALILLKGKEIG